MRSGALGPQQTWGTIAHCDAASAFMLQWYLVLISYRYASEPNLPRICASSVGKPERQFCWVLSVAHYRRPVVAREPVARESRLS
jgi:hypothetical protein